MQRLTLIGWCGLAVALIAGTLALTRETDATVPDDACAGVEAYIAEARAITEGVTTLPTVGTPTSDELRATAASFHDAIAAFHNLTPPPAAEDFHTAVIAWFTVAADAATHAAEEGFFAMLGHADRLTAAQAIGEETGAAFEDACGVTVLTASAAQATPVVPATPAR